MLLNVISYQVRQFAEGVPGLLTERVLQGLLEQRPEDADLLSSRTVSPPRRTGSSGGSVSAALGGRPGVRAGLFAVEDGERVSEAVNR